MCTQFVTNPKPKPWPLLPLLYPMAKAQTPHKTKDNIRHAERASILRGCVLKSPLWMAVISCRPSIRSSSSLSLASCNAKYSIYIGREGRGAARCLTCSASGRAPAPTVLWTFSRSYTGHTALACYLTSAPPHLQEQERCCHLESHVTHLIRASRCRR